MGRVPPFPAVGQRGDVFLLRGGGAGDGQLLESGTRAAMPAEDEFAALADDAGDTVDDDEAIPDLDDPALRFETREAEMRSEQAVGLPLRRARDPRQPEESSGAAHAVVVADGDDVVEARASETIPAAGCVIGISPRIFGDPFPVPSERDVQLIGVRRTRAENRGRPEEKRAARLSQREDAGIGSVDLAAGRRGRARGRRSEQEQGGFVPRAGGKALAFEEREGGADRRTEIVVSPAERKEVRAIVGSVTWDGAVGLHQGGEEIRGGDGLRADGLGERVVDRALDELRPGQQLQEQAMVIRGVLAEAAVGTDELGALFGEFAHAALIPTSSAADARPEGADGLQADRFRDAVVVLLRKGVIEVGADPTSGEVCQAGRERQPRVGRCRVIAESLDGVSDGDQAEGGFLAAHPVRAAVGRIARHPILERRPEELDVPIGTVAEPGADERIGPGETGKLPDSLDVIGAGIVATRPMGVGIGGMSGEDAARPAVGPADLHQPMREDPCVTSGEGVRLGDRRMSAGDRPRFELRREVRAVELSDRQARRADPPFRRIEPDGEILPWAQRRTPFPDAELTLARPQRTPEQPARTEVMEERKEH